MVEEQPGEEAAWETIDIRDRQKICLEGNYLYQDEKYGLVTGKLKPASPA
ncbi:hypothetical protein ACKF11_02345 [Methylobacillus sp. Pita2]